MSACTVLVCFVISHLDLSALRENSKLTDATTQYLVELKLVIFDRLDCMVSVATNRKVIHT